MDAVKTLWAEVLGFGSFAEPPDSLPLRLLGLDAIPAGRDAVRAAFRARLKQFHPDAHPERFDAPVSLEGEPTSVQEMVWARDILLRKIPEPVTDGNGDHGFVDYPSRWVCPGCKSERLNWRGRPFDRKRRGRWDDYCEACADDKERERLSEEAREMRLQARTDLTCAECGTTFTPPRSDAIYCSPACRQRAWRKRR